MADAHDYFGSAAMNWEGGEEGERKIQQVKPYMGIRRKNAAWQKLSLQKIYTSDSIDWLINRLPKPVSRDNITRQSSHYRAYKDKNEAMKSTTGEGAISMYETIGGIIILYRPVGVETNSRSSYAVLNVSVDDTRGEYRFGCWFTHLEYVVSREIPKIITAPELTGLITRNILALPMFVKDPGAPLGDKTLVKKAMFYLISDD